MRLFKIRSPGTESSREDHLNSSPNPFSHTVHITHARPEILIGVSSHLLDTSIDLDQQSDSTVSVLQSLAQCFVLIPFASKTGYGSDTSDQTDNPSSHLHADGYSISRLSGYITCSRMTTDILPNKTEVNCPELVNPGLLSQLHEMLIPVEEIWQLADRKINQNFIQRVCVMHRWQQLNAREDKTIYPLVRFHKRHIHVYLSHSQKKTDEIKSILSRQESQDIDELYTEYIHKVMDVLECPPTRRNHVFVLRRLLSTIDTYLSKDELQDIHQSIDEYESGKESIKVPLTQLRYHASQYAVPDLTNSVYLFPYPQESMFSEHSDVAIAI